MLKKFIVQLLVIYMIINVAVYFGSDYLVFIPQKSSYSKLENEVKLKTTDGKTISALYMPNSSKYVILYSHGNDEDLGDIMPTLDTFYGWGFSVMAYDYEGYGTSEGKPSERATYADIEAAYNYLIQQKKISPQNIILFGRSLGSGPTVELATQQPVGGVILESAFVSIYRIITKYPIFLFDKYPSLRNINKIKAPILFIHGTQDEIVPFWNAQELYDNFTGTKEYCWVEGVGHNDLSINSSQVRSAILKFIQHLSQHR